MTGVDVSDPGVRELILDPHVLVAIVVLGAAMLVALIGALLVGADKPRGHFPWH